jgi:membrane fusion protein, copper/silver efflux system
MTNQVAATVPARRRRAGVYVLLLIATAGGVYAGTRWHARIAPMLGIKAADSGAPIRDTSEAGSAQQLWTCGMHPQVIQDQPGDCPICHMKLTPLKMDTGGIAVGSSAIAPTDSQERRVKY